MATPHHPHQVPIKQAARKLPIKRKTPDSEPPLNPNPNLSPSPSPNPNPAPNLRPPSTAIITATTTTPSPTSSDDSKAPPPFKYHRIWSESDELRFLQALLDASAEGLSFPRDLTPFFDRFSRFMPQPYTKSQLSEKLRRLRKKFRVVSARLSRGLDASLLTPHDRALFHLSKQLWHPAFAASSPFTKKPKKKPLLVTPAAPAPTSPVSPQKIKVKITYPSASTSASSNLDGHNDSNGGNLVEDQPALQSGAGALGRDVSKIVMDVFNQSLKDARSVNEQRGLQFPDHLALRLASGQGRATHLAKRWQEQRVAELDVLAQRLMLVLEHASSK